METVATGLGMLAGAILLILITALVAAGLIACIVKVWRWGHR